MYTVALPVETKVRELNGKLWLAANLAQRGYRVAIGELGALKASLPVVKPNIYIGDSAVHKQSRIELYKRLKQAEITVAVHDTEGGIIYSDDYYRGRLSQEVLKYVDCFLAWGEETVDIFHSVSKEERIVVGAVGNPAFDLLHHDYRDFYRREREELRDRFKQFVLVNTHFGFYNHFDREKFVEPLRTKFPGLFEFKKKLFYAFVGAVKELSHTNQSVNFVLRPHPSENFARYKEIFSDFPNVFVEHHYSVHPWALAASLVLHNGCTTGVEAALLERPVVSYRPVRDVKWDVKLPNLVSHCAENVSDLQGYVRRYCSQNTTSNVPLNKEQRRTLEKIINPHDGKSAERIGDIFDSLNVSDTIRAGSLRERSIQKKIRRVAHHLKRRFYRTALDQSKEGYAEQKFSQISLAEMAKLLSVFKEISPRLQNVNIEKIGNLENLFWVY